MTNISMQTGITDELAPELGVTQWIDASGHPLATFGLDKMPGAFKVIYCFQDANAACHLTGFPAMASLVDAFRGSSYVSFAAVQTVFENFASNNYERMVAAQRRYALPIVFGHDAGEGREGAGSVLMQRYQNGGTPWFIIVDPDGMVIYNQFQIDVDRVVAGLKRAESAPPLTKPDPSILTWRGVLELTRDGNPPPHRRLELSDAEWRRRLNAEQYRVMRQAGTERAHSSAMCTLFGPGVYACGCCDTDLFDASSKFDSKSGWPSFTQTLAPGLVAYHADRSHGMTRVETTCNVCDAHLGHVFPDGPKPSGLRFCMNGASLRKR